jgi:hypothetical protein
MNIFTHPTTIPNSMYTLVNKPVVTPVKLTIPSHDQTIYRDNQIVRTTFTKTSMVKS